MSTENYDNIKQQLDRIEQITSLGVKNVLTIEDVALLTGLSVSHIYTLTSKQEIPHSKPNGKKVYFKKSEIEDWLLQNRILTKKEIDNKATTYIAIKH